MFFIYTSTPSPNKMVIQTQTNLGLKTSGLLIPNKAGLFKGSFFWGEGGGQFDHPFIFLKKLIEYQYNFIQLLTLS